MTFRQILWWLALSVSLGGLWLWGGGRAISPAGAGPTRFSPPPIPGRAHLHSRVAARRTKKGRKTRVYLRSVPRYARYRLRLNNGRLRRGRMPIWRRLKPGTKVELHLTKPGYKPYKSSFVVPTRRKVRKQFCLTRVGQLLTCLRVMRTSAYPKGVAISRDNRNVWVSLLDKPPALNVFSLTEMRKLKNIYLGKQSAIEVEYSKDETRVYASQLGTGKVFEVDRRTYKRLRTFVTGGRWPKVLKLSRDGKRLYASHWRSHNIAEIDLVKGRTVRMFKTARIPRGMYISPDDRFLYVASFGKGWLQKIDLKTGTLNTVFNKGSNLRHIVGDEKRGRLYISDMGRNCVWVHDLKTGRTKRLARTDHRPNTIDLTPDGRVLFVSNRGKDNPISGYINPGPEWGSVLVFDALTGRKLDAIVGGNQSTGLDVSHDGRLLVFSDLLSHQIWVYQIPTTSVLLQGKGGRSRVYRRELTKPNWRKRWLERLRRERAQLQRAKKQKKR